ncbi:MAG: cupredoxin domain-containing protein [Acidobacteriota bacterium]|nr:cupredoxin domain-containing protein [Acidobacteriota bacterium]
MRNKTNFVVKNAAFILLLMFAVMQISLAGQTNKNRQNTKPQKAKVQITHQGFQPASLTLQRGVSAQITFLRTTDATCAKEVVFADYGIRRELPLNKEVIVSFTPKKAGEFTFSCGMNMMRGKLIVK